MKIKLIIGIMMGMAGGVLAEDALFERFVNPPAEARPFVRWWWNGDCVNEKEIVREIDIMKAAGIGGFEINPIELPVDQNNVGANGLEWLSPEWNRMVRLAADAAHQRDMIADLIVGSGWPFGGEFLKSGEMTQRIHVNEISIKGPAKFSQELDSLIQSKKGKGKRAPTDMPEPKFLFARLAPLSVSDIAQTIDLTGNVVGGRKLEFDVPKGRYALYVGTVEEGFSTVSHGAPGAKGPVLNHYDKPAVQSYLQRMSEKLNPALGGKLGPAVRAVFCDSIELSKANWTTDFAEQFKERRGYDVVPYLPFMVDFGKAIEGDGKWADVLKRARYDFCRTMVELFHERFTHTYNNWCHENGTVSRFQAYGSPWLLGMLDGYLIPDIPESNNWLFSNPDQHGFLVWTKYTSSGGHLKGRRIVSTEAMTNTRGVFKTTLEQIKAADDYNFIMGINHSVLHGFNYSPREAGFPGWVRFGAYFNEQNTWWPYFKSWATYNARLSAVFQATRPVVQVAILGPEADTWSENGLERPPFHNKPWYVHQLWKAISSCGSSADYISENVLQAATFDDGKLCYGPMAYDVLLVAGAKSLQPATAAAILKLADAGGRIVFVGEVPQRSPLLKEAVAADEAVRKDINSAIEKHSAKVSRRDAPADKEKLTDWTDALLNELGLDRFVRFARPDADVYQIHQRDGERDVCFVVNTDEEKAIPVEARFDVSGKTAWRWDPETGRREQKAMSADGKIALNLQPLESVLLVFDKNEPAEMATEQPVPDETKATVLDGAWQCEFHPVYNKPFTRESFALCDLGTSSDATLRSFAGAVVYKQSFHLDTVEKGAFLDLGTVHGVSEVVLNGKPLGVRWYGRHLYDIRPAVRKGANQLEVKVATVLFNYASSLKDNAAVKPWVHAKEKVGAGLVGGVKLLAAKE